MGPETPLKSGGRIFSDSSATAVHPLRRTHDGTGEAQVCGNSTQGGYALMMELPAQLRGRVCACWRDAQEPATPAATVYLPSPPDFADSHPVPA